LDNRLYGLFTKQTDKIPIKTRKNLFSPFSWNITQKKLVEKTDGKTDQKQTDKEREEKKIFFSVIQDHKKQKRRSQYYHYETFRRTGKINMRIRE